LAKKKFFKERGLTRGASTCFLGEENGTVGKRDRGREHFTVGGGMRGCPKGGKSL